MFKAALFDLDGTLVDNMALHTDAWVEVSTRHGHAVPRDRFLREWAGKKNEELIPMMLGRAATDDEVARIAHDKETLYRSLAATRLVELPGTTALLGRLKADGLKLAVATAAPEGNRKLVLDPAGLGLGRFFDAVVGPEGNVRGKPAPDIFLACAKALGVAPADCIVFEDAINGVKAGVAAGMQVVAVTTTTDAQSLRDAGAKWVIADYESPLPL
ncbi:MAG: HAD family phosphatase [Myxococcaceae bacterium]|nr:HAD family phosphatase [Myxococcaceae bacterium]